MSIEHLARLVKYHTLTRDPALVDFLVRLLLALSARLVSQVSLSAESDICSIYTAHNDWYDPEYWTTHVRAEFPGVADLAHVDQERVMACLDGVIRYFKFKTTYLNALHTVTVQMSDTPFGMYRLCQELGVWPTDFSAVTRSVAVPQAMSWETTKEEIPVLAALDEALGVLDLARIALVYARDYLPGIVLYQSVYQVEHFEKVSARSGVWCKCWTIREVSVTDAAGRAWRVLLEASCNNMDLSLVLVRCAETGLPLSSHNSTGGLQWWCGLQGFVHHPIAMNFALGVTNKELPVASREDLSTMRKRWHPMSLDKLDAGGPVLLTRLYVLQQHMSTVLFAR
jgi:hypothetical protein